MVFYQEIKSLKLLMANHKVFDSEDHFRNISLVIIRHSHFLWQKLIEAMIGTQASLFETIETIYALVRMNDPAGSTRSCYIRWVDLSTADAIDTTNSNELHDVLVVSCKVTRARDHMAINRSLNRICESP